MKKHEGDYIQFGGLGIIDGIKLAPDKLTLYRIEGSKIEEGLYMGVKLHRYRAKKGEWVSRHSFKQACRVFTKKEWEAMPICGISTKRLWSEESGTWSCTVINPDK
jgi:hypothetical protein